ncbi:hypothetical protein CTT30_22260 [Vibrio coralliilyticus]|nr:hypothetical protein CTT30_22260 [Vibrio coralliilyticus]
MIRLPAFTFSVSESNSRESSSTWPASVSFPLVPSGQEFSIMNSLPQKSALRILTLTIDLSQIMNSKQGERIIH